MTVALTYFTLILPVEFNLLDMWAYWWIYAINFVIYIATMKNYRTVYLVFLRDIAHIVGATKLASDQDLTTCPVGEGGGSTLEI